MTTMVKLETPTTGIEPQTLALVAHRCREELCRYKRGEPCDDRFCLELFRRAVMEQDGDAWHELHSIFHEQVLSWCRSATHGSSADPDEVVCVAWEKFWLNFTPTKLTATCSAAGVLKYLKMCARSAAMDAIRSRTPSISLDEAPIERAGSEPVPSEVGAERDARARFWAIINSTLRDDRERIMAHLSYEVGLKSAEIQSRRPDLFPSVADVYHVTRNVLDRLKRNRELQTWFQQDRC